jgi:hypothetical protein
MHFFLLSSHIKRRIKLLCISLAMVLLAMGCHRPKNKIHPQGHNKHSTGNIQSINNSHRHFSKTDLVDNAIGVVTVVEDAQFDSTFSFNIYNLDSTLWRKADFSPQLTDGKKIAPYMFNYDDYLVIFRCKAITGNFYKVIINEKKGTEKLIPIKQKYLEFETWQDHILKHVFAVDFSLKTNPLRSDTTNEAKELPYDKYQYYQPVDIKGYWLKVKDENGKEGWIKWRNEKGKLLITNYYDA